MTAEVVRAVEPVVKFLPSTPPQPLSRRISRTHPNLTLAWAPYSSGWSLGAKVLKAAGYVGVMRSLNETSCRRGHDNKGWMPASRRICL